MEERGASWWITASVSTRIRRRNRTWPDCSIRIHSNPSSHLNPNQLSQLHPFLALVPTPSRLRRSLAPSTPRVVSGHLDNSTPICGTRSPSPEMDAAGNSPWKIILPPSFLRLFAQGRCFGGKAISQRDVDSFRSNWARLGRKFFDHL